MYRYESWTIKKAECQQTDAFELWHWTAISNQSVLKEINSAYSLEGLMLKLQYFGQLMQKANSLEKTHQRRDWGQEEKGWQRTRWFDVITNSVDINLSKLREMVKDREACCAAVHEVTKSWTGLNDWTTAFLCPKCQSLKDEAQKSQLLILYFLVAIEWLEFYHYDSSFKACCCN